MTPEVWARIEELYHEALRLEQTQRAAFLDDACAGDEALRQQVELLLAQTAASGFLETPAFEIATQDITLTREAGSLLTGQQLGSYVIQERIGAGGMGEVYRARDLRLEREVAIKVLSPDLGNDPDRRARLLREARAA